MLALQRAARGDQLLAQLWLAVQLAKGRDATPDRRKAAAKALRELASRNFPPAHLWLRIAAMEGWERKPDPEEARGEYETAARAGVAQGAEAMGRLYQNGAGPIPVDPARSEEWFGRAYAAGRPYEAVDAGVEAESPRRPDQDFRRALAWFQRAADAGFPGAKAEMAKTIGLLMHNPRDLPNACGLAREAAAAGLRSGFGTLGALQIAGAGCAKDPKAGVASLERAVAMGSVDAMNLLANELASGVNVAKDIAHAKQLFEQASRGGLTGAACSLGVLIARDHPGPEGVKAGYPWLARGAIAGWSDCQLILGEAIARGQLPEHPDRLGGVRLLEIAQERGDVRAQSLLAGLYIQGVGVARDVERGRKLLDAAAAKNDPTAILLLARCYSTEACGLPGDPVKHLQLVERAVALGNGDAKATLGIMLLRGVGVPVDRGRGLALLNEVANLGHTGAMRALYNAYHDPAQPDHDFALAFKWAKQAVDAGDPGALNSLADCYRTGTGTSADAVLASQTYKRSADAGNVDGMNAWALMQLDGIGTPRDIAGGAKYLQMAVDRGMPNALMTLASLSMGRALGPSDPARALAAITLAITQNTRTIETAHVSALDEVRLIRAATLRDHLRATLPHDDLVRADGMIAEMAEKMASARP